MSILIRIEVSDGPTLRYRADERDKAMKDWDRLVENAIPGERLRLINDVNDRVVSEYTNNFKTNVRGGQ